jgi:hypothetical protein
VRSGSIEEIAGPSGSQPDQRPSTADDGERMQIDPVREEFRDAPSRQIDLEAPRAAMVNGRDGAGSEEPVDEEME